MQWFLLPSVRWYFRRKVRGVIEEVSVRLKIDIPQFKLTRRRALIDRLLADPKVLAAADDYSAANQVPRSVAMERVSRYAQEIVPAFNAYVYFRIGYWLAKTFARTIYRVRLGYTDSDSLAAINPKSTVVFVMNHRSNMDYILVSFLAAERVALSYAVGEWARIWPLQGLIRAMGAYFVRRNSGDPLYRMVLQRYVQMATEGGVPQAMYPEGGLTIDGKLRAPKLGLLDYMLKGFDPRGERDLVFIPVGINYDRVIEDRTLLRKLDATAPRGNMARTVGITGRYLLKQLGFTLLGRRFRFGYACVNFGKPISMREHADRTGIDFRALEGKERQARVAVVGEAADAPHRADCPGTSCATCCCRADARSGAHHDRTGVEVRGERADAEGGGRGRPRLRSADRPRLCADGGFAHPELAASGHRTRDGLFSANPQEMPTVLAYYANSISHLLVNSSNAPNTPARLRAA